jgi:hypothetical protein
MNSVPRVVPAGNQRWREHRASYRPPREPLDPRCYAVDLVSEKDAKAFVCRHHYSCSFPASRLRVGLYRARPATRAELVGVAVFSVPMTQAVITRWTGLPPSRGVELGRLVLLDEVEGNAETWFLARAFRLLAATLPEVHAVVSFSDPMQRVAEDGHLVTPGHVGSCLQSFNGRHVGRSKSRTLVLDRGGRVVSDRALAKIRNDERGAGYAYSQLVAAGAPTIHAGESGRDYVSRALIEGPFRKVRHPGNLAYVWPSATAPRGVVNNFPAALPYRKAFNTVVTARQAACCDGNSPGSSQTIEVDTVADVARARE